MALQNETKLNNGVTMPLQGYGVFQITDEAVCKEGVKAALAAGVRLIDTAACYGNERAVGAAIRESGIPREDIFISSKVWIQDAGYEKTKASFAKTLENLGTDYLDLYLIHMPYGDYHGAWRAMRWRSSAWTRRCLRRTRWRFRAGSAGAWRLRASARCAPRPVTRRYLSTSSAAYTI